MKKIFFSIVAIALLFCGWIYYVKHKKEELVTEYAFGLQLKTGVICSKADNVIEKDGEFTVKKLNILNNDKDLAEFFCVFNSKELVGVSYRITYDFTNKNSDRVGFTAKDSNLNGILDYFDPGQDFTLKQAEIYNSNTKDLDEILTIVFNSITRPQ